MKRLLLLVREEGFARKFERQRLCTNNEAKPLLEVSVDLNSTVVSFVDRRLQMTQMRGGLVCVIDASIHC